MTPRIALLGYGNMGREIHALAIERGLPVTAILDPNLADYATPMDADALRDTDVCIDCTTPDAAFDNIRGAAALGKDVVVGTTGWLARLDEVRAIVTAANVGLLYASNFSIGMQLFRRIVEQAAQLLSAFDAYDVAVQETHHNKKKDAPSGTALTLAESILRAFPAKTTIVQGNPDGSIAPHELHVSSQRVGFVPGTHVVTFDGKADAMELRHTVRNRRGLAEGALLAAQWVYGKKGIFTIEDMINDRESV